MEIQENDFRDLDHAIDVVYNLTVTAFGFLFLVIHLIFS